MWRLVVMTNQVKIVIMTSQLMMTVKLAKVTVELAMVNILLEGIRVNFHALRAQIYFLRVALSTSDDKLQLLEQLEREQKLGNCYWINESSLKCNFGPWNLKSISIWPLNLQDLGSSYPHVTQSNSITPTTTIDVDNEPRVTANYSKVWVLIV